MAERYIDAEDLKRVISANDWSNPAVPDVVNIIIDRSPTSDVVPRAEVDKIIHDLEQKRINDIEEIGKRYYRIGYDKAKQEVAREIFVEIEQHLVRRSTMDGNSVCSISTHTFNRIKKKYTGEGK